jgi:hypothetical protein
MQPMQPKMKPDTDAEAEVTYRWLEMPELMLIDPTRLSISITGRP